MPDTVLGTEVTSVNEATKILALIVLMSQRNKQTITKMNVKL